MKPLERMLTGVLLSVVSEATLVAALYEVSAEPPAPASEVTTSSSAAKIARRFEIREVRFPVSLSMVVSAVNSCLSYRVL